MITVWISVDDDGNISQAGTTPPELIPGDNVPDFQYSFEMTWEEYEELWKYKIVDGELVLI